MSSDYRIEQARKPQDVAAVRDLIHEYVRGLNIDIAIRGFEAELPLFPGPYAPPMGGLLLARSGTDEALGCVSLQPLERAGTCELKRLYVRPSVRSTGLGRALVTSALDLAAALGHREVMLDTLPWMEPAIALYRSLGFEPVEPYWNNLIPGIIYFGKKLHGD